MAHVLYKTGAAGDQNSELAIAPGVDRQGIGLFSDQKHVACTIKLQHCKY